jgi:hypothetical protein
MTTEEIQQLKQLVLRELPQVLLQDTEFALVLEGMLSERFPRRDEFARLLDEVCAFRQESGQQFEQIDRRFEQIDRRFEQGDRRFEKIEQRLGKVDGRTLEMEFRDKAAAYLGTVLRGVRVISAGDLAEDLAGVLTEEEWQELLRTDVVLRGRASLGGQRVEVMVAVEVSVKVDQDDVSRAARRAALLRKKGWKSLAVAAGEDAAEGVIEMAARLGVAVLKDGQQFNWPEALAAA